MSAKLIRDLIDPILRHCEKIAPWHEVLQSLPSDAEHKILIMLGRQWGALTDEQCEMLIDVYGLKDA